MGNARIGCRCNLICFYRKLLFLWTRRILKTVNFTQTGKTMTPEAERFNGWAAMLGFVAAVGAYATTGNIIPGIF